MYYYYEQINKRLYYFSDESPCVYHKEVNIRELAEEWWKNDPIWVQSFGKVYQSEGFMYKQLEIAPCPQVSLAWMKDNSIFTGGELDVEKSILIAKERVNKFIDQRVK